MRTALLATWPLPLIAGLLPMLGTLIAYPLSVHLGLVEACNPLIDGCVSISRAARHDLPNHLFRALLLPAAALQALCWLLCSRWLVGPGEPRPRGLRALPWIGIVAALFLVLYGTFLGTEGTAYRWMRRYGVVFYFGGTCLAMLLTTGALQASRWRDHPLRRALVALCVALPLIGLVNVLGPLALPGEAARDALQNSTEWWAAVIFTLYFLALAWLWRATRFELGVSTRLPAP
jgi:uncharacterized membrane protein YhaH (DUF805 family)